MTVIYCYCLLLNHLKNNTKIIAFFLYFIWYIQILVLSLVQQTETNQLFEKLKKMKTQIEFYQIPSYLQDDAINLAVENEKGIHDYDSENISDDFIFEYDEDNDELISAVYRRFDDGGLAL